MTLIFSAASPYGAMFGGDILMSREGVDGNDLHYPLRNTPSGEPIAFTSPVAGITSFKQKVFFFNKYNAFLWCGSYLIARVMIKQCCEDLNKELDINLLEIAERINLTKDDVLSIGLIYLKWMPFGVNVQSLACSYNNIDDIDLHFSGSGSWYTFDGGSTDVSNPPKHYDKNNELNRSLELVNWVFSKIGKLLQDEAIFGENLNFNFGGWYDIFCASPDGFSRVNYVIRFWSYYQDRVNLRLPIAFSNKSDLDKLIVTTINPRLPSEKGLIGISIPNIFDNDLPDVNHSISYEPTIQLHMFADLDYEKSFFCWQNGKSNAIIFNINDTEVILDSHPDWIDWVKKAFDANREGRVIDIYDGLSDKSGDT